MADEFGAIADIVCLIVTMRGQDGQDGGPGGWDEFEPVARRHVEALGRRREHPFLLGLAVIRAHPERTRHGNEELVTGLVRMSAPGDTGTQVEKMKFPADLERQLLPGLSEREGTTLITSRRQIEQGAGRSHRGLATRALRYSP